MKTFPSVLHVKNRASFDYLNQQRTLAYMRKHIYEHMISHSEDVMFDLTNHKRDYSGDDWDKSIVETLRSELHALGWKTQLSFGDTALFVYSTDKPPVTCWDGEF